MLRWLGNVTDYSNSSHSIWSKKYDTWLRLGKETRPLTVPNSTRIWTGLITCSCSWRGVVSLALGVVYWWPSVPWSSANGLLFLVAGLLIWQASYLGMCLKTSQCLTVSHAINGGQSGHGWTNLSVWLAQIIAISIYLACVLISWLNYNLISIY